jgi:hypothetical protein
MLAQGATARGALALALAVVLFPARIASTAPGDRLRSGAIRGQPWGSNRDRDSDGRQQPDLCDNLLSGDASTREPWSAVTSAGLASAFPCADCRVLDRR